MRTALLTPKRSVSVQPLAAAVHPQLLGSQGCDGPLRVLRGGAGLR